MRKTHTHFEQVPIEAAEKVLEQENLLAKRARNREHRVENSVSTPSESQTLLRKSRVSVP
jgi:hypothetical protein